MNQKVLLSFFVLFLLVYPLSAQTYRQQYQYNSTGGRTQRVRQTVREGRDLVMETNNPQVPRHHDRWFEADASYKGAEYFDKYYGSKQTGYVTGDPNYFDKDSFKYGNKSTYINPRTGILNQTTNPISGYFHWTDIAIYFPVIGLLPTLFYL